MIVKYMVLLFILIPYVLIAEPKIIDIDAFIKTAIEKDDKFQEILIDQLSIKYNRDLKLAPQALIAQVKSQYGTSIDENKNGVNTTVSLEKLFRGSGTTVTAAYNNINYSTGTEGRDSLSLSISQDIAKNAFGRMARKEASIIGLENHIIEYQLVEAYEDYLASLLLSYFDWYLAFQNRIAAEGFYKNAKDQEKNMRSRRAKNIAYKIEVDKMILQTLSRKEILLVSKGQYSSQHARIKETMRDKSEIEYVPKESLKYVNREISFNNNFISFTREGRTFKILNILEKSKSEQVTYNMDDLFPSARLLLDSTVSGNEGIFNAGNTKSLYAGFSLGYPFGDSRKRAKLETSRLELKKAKLTTKAKKSSLRSDLYELYTKIQENKEKNELIRKKVSIADRIYKEEKKNYRQGRSKINDLISAGTELENYRFSLLSAEVNLNKLIIEWLRLTDKLVLDQ